MQPLYEIMQDTSPDPHADPEGFSISYYVHRTLAVLAVIVVALFLWQVRDALLLGFAGVLIAVFVHGLARPLSRHTGLPVKGALTAVLLLILVFLVGFWWLLGPRIADQFSQLTQTLPQTFEQVQQDLSRSQLGSTLIEQIQQASRNWAGQAGFSQVTGAATTLFNAIAGLLIVLFLGLFLMFDPHLYRRGVVLLVPKRFHQRAWEVLDALGQALWHWLLGRFVAILFVFAATALGLWMLGVPLALTLGFIAGLLDFVPWIGPTIAAVPGVLLAFTLGPTKALYALLLYILIQQLEGNLVTPLVQQRAVSLPPVLVLLALTSFGFLFGLLGVLLAVPLLVVTMVLVSMLYAQDALHEPVSVPGNE